MVSINGDTYQRAVFVDSDLTNNICEYIGVALAMYTAHELGVKDLTLYSDSKLVVNQVSGRYNVNSDHLLYYRDQILKLKKEFNSFKLKWISRDRNIEADKLCNKILSDRKTDETVDMYQSKNFNGNNPQYLLDIFSQKNTS